ncbi:transglycosylase domain-containing protein [Vallitalea okinawensis]|uniref:transglycosylase domain-containing protein n=1 Tax=Vallitalea okinawensis TaxID=2078660 RepID=UPI000CFACEDF|nr:PBP1A family penicillin-binding protein [Vallitalea okinawensis]
MKYSNDSNNNDKKYKSKKKKTKHKSGLRRFFRILFIMILVIFFAGSGAALGLVTGIVKSTPPISANKITPEGFATIIYDDSGNEITRLSGAEANRIWVDIEDIPDKLEYAFIAIEDERFYTHSGIDLRAIMRAAVVNLQTRSISEGGSTITQQLIKYNVLTFDQTWVRKIQEQYLALTLEKDLSDKYGKEEAKNTILESYLNTINLANGAYGVQSAAEIYFGKNVGDLTVAESAVIAATANSPTLFDPLDNPEANTERASRILDKMYEQNYITADEYATAQKENVYENIKQIDLENQENATFNSYFVDAVIEDVLADFQEAGYSEDQAYNSIYRGGLTIYTTQDSNMQKITEEAMLNEELFPSEEFALLLDYRLSVTHADGEVEHMYNPVYTNPKENWGISLFKTEDEANAYIEAFKDEKLVDGDDIIAENKTLVPQPQASMVIMDYRTGEVKSLVGGRGEKKGNRTLNRATDTTRSPGSTFKPLAAYAPALDTAGYTPATVIDDVPFTIKEAYPKPYTPNNWYAHSGRTDWYWGLSTVRLGITQSMNILAVKTVYDIGIPTAFDYLENFGFTTLVDADKGYSLPLGGLTNGVTNLELTASYGTIANSGVYTEPILYTKVVDQNGNIILQNVPETHTVIKDTTAFLLTDMMVDVINHGTGSRADFDERSMPIAGKTGTAQNSKDLWLVAYTPYYVAGVWTGFDREMTIDDNSYHLELWQSVMEDIHIDKELPYKEFDQPPGITQAFVCTESGKLATELCQQDPRGSRARWEYFVAGAAPSEYCEVHVDAQICEDSDLFAREGYCPEESIKTRIYIKRPEDMRLNYDELDEKTLSRIVDVQYEFPSSLEGEYCNVHGPGMETEEEDSEFDLLDLLNGDDDDDTIFTPGNDDDDTNENNANDNPVDDNNNNDSLDDFFDLPSN